MRPPFLPPGTARDTGAVPADGATARAPVARALTDAFAGSVAGAVPPAGVVLVVDDAEAHRYAVTHWLERAGFRVLQAATGTDALELARTGVDLVILDVQLPDLDGFEVARRLKGGAATAHLPVLHLSAERVALSDRVAGLEIGADAYLTHPFEPAGLVASARALIRLGRSERAVREQNAALEAANARLAAQTLELQSRTAAAEASLAALAVSEARFRTVHDASPDGVLLLRPIRDGGSDAITDFEFVYGNPAAERMLGGGAADAFVGRRMRTVFPSAEAEGYFGAYVGVLETGVPYRREDRYTHDGIDVGVRLTAVRAGDLVHLRHEDVAERLQAESERARLLAESEAARREADAARQAAEAANQAKTQFLTTMSHELRTPLNAIQGHAQLLEMGLHGPVSEAQRVALTRIDRAQRHLLGLVDDVLNYARLGSGQVEHDIQQVLVADVVADVLPMVEPQLAAKGLTVEVHLPEAGPGGPTGEPPVPVWADREKLGQIFLNLLSNAVKFTPAGGRIAVELTARGDSSGPSDVAYFRVADTGIGLPPNMLEAVFEPFVQVRSDYTRPQQGTGLGLAISRDLARGMGGDLRARSMAGAGAAFTVTLRRVHSSTGEKVDRRTERERRSETRRRRSGDGRREKTPPLPR